MADTDVVVAGDPARGEATADEPSSPARRRERTPGGWNRDAIFRLALAVSVLAVLAVGVKGAVTGWQPTGDDGYFALRSHDVFSRHVPLLGTASSASSYSGVGLNHPGPLQFDLLAVPVRVFGVAAGVAIGTAAINAASVAAVGLMLRRRAGPAAGCLGLAAMAVLGWSLGGVLVHEPFGPYAVVMPFAVLLTATAIAVAGGMWALPVVALAGSFVLQTHLSYVLLVPGLSALAVGATGLGLWRQRRADPAAWPGVARRAVRWGAATVAVTALCWLQPLVQQLGGRSGNLGNLARAAGSDGPAAATPRLAVRSLAGLVARPPLWFPPTFRSPLPFEDNTPDGLRWPFDLASLGLVVAALVVAAVVGRRRSDRLVVGAAATALSGLALGYLTIVQAPFYGVAGWTYVRWLWPLSLWVWVALVLAAVRLGPARARSAARSRPALVTLAGVCLVAGVATLPASDNGGAPQRFRRQLPAEALVSAALEAVGDDRPVLVDYRTNRAAFSFAPLLMARLADEGIPFRIEKGGLERQVGHHRWASDDDPPPVQLTLVTDPDDGPSGGELIFHDTGLTPDEQATYDEALAALDRLNANDDALPIPEQARRTLATFDPEKLDALDAAVAEGAITLRHLGWIEDAVRLDAALESDPPPEPVELVDPDQISPALVREALRLDRLVNDHQVSLFVVRPP